MGAAGNKKPKKHQHGKSVPAYEKKAEKNDNDYFKKKK